MRGCRPRPTGGSISRATSWNGQSPLPLERSRCSTATARPAAEIEGDRVHFVPGSSGLRVLDHRTGAVRPATTRDFVEYVRLADGLPNLPYLATAFSTNADIEPRVSDAWRLFLLLSNSRKAVVSGAFTEHGVPRMVEMMSLFRRDAADFRARPMAIFTITATGNFRSARIPART
jgi:trimethylamine--corrinoid protein Co-methyltransferase